MARRHASSNLEQLMEKTRQWARDHSVNPRESENLKKRRNSRLHLGLIHATTYPSAEEPCRLDEQASRAPEPFPWFKADPLGGWAAWHLNDAQLGWDVLQISWAQGDKT